MKKSHWIKKCTYQKLSEILHIRWRISFILTKSKKWLFYYQKNACKCVSLLNLSIYIKQSYLGKKSWSRRAKNPFNTNYQQLVNFGNMRHKGKKDILGVLLKPQVFGKVEVVGVLLDAPSFSFSEFPNPSNY